MPVFFSSLLGVLGAFVLLASTPWAFFTHAPIKTALLLLGGGLAWAALLALRTDAVSLLRRHPLGWLAIAFLAVTLLSTVFSLDPHRWQETSPLLPQHPLVLAACLGFFLLAAAASRNEASRRHWTDLLVKISLPLCLVALYQHLHIISPGLAGVAFGSLTGNPLYLAGALLFLLPLTTWKWWEAWQAATGRWNRPSLLLALLLGLQILTLLLTQKRGPVVALLAAACFTLVLLGLLTQRHALLRWSLRLGVVAFLILFLLAAAHKVGLPVRQIPIFGRLSLIVPLGERTGDPFRSSLWQAASSFLTHPDSLLLPVGTDDPHAGLRPWLGYGPDTVEAILPSRWLHFAAWPKPFIEVSCHSSFWDLFLTLGLTGLVLYFLILATVLGVALTAMGLLARPPPVRWRFAGWLLLGTSLGATALSLLLHAGYLGLGAQLGLLAGTLGFLLQEHRQAAPPASAAPLPGKTCFLLALLAGIIAHWIDLAFLFPTPGTALLFWIAAGGILGCAWPEAPAPNETHPAATARTDGLLGGVVFLLVLHAVLWPYAGEGWFARQPPMMWAALAVILLLPCVWWCGVCLASGRFVRTSLLAFGLLAGSGILLFMLPNLLAARETPETLGPITPIWIDAMGWVWPTLLLLATAGLLFFSANRAQLLHPPRRAFAFLLATIMAWWVFLPPTQPWLRSEAAYGASLRIRQSSAKIPLLHHAIHNRPSNFRARLSLARHSEQALPSILTGEQILRQGIQLSAFNPLAFELADLLFLQALATSDVEEQQALASEAREYFLMAARYIPRWETAWFSAALLSELLLDEPGLAADFRTTAMETTRQREYPEQRVNTLGWAQHYLDRSNRFSSTPAELPLARQALFYFERAAEETIERLRQRPPSPREQEFLAPHWFWIYAGQGLMHRRLGDEEAARSAFATAALVAWEDRPFDPARLLLPDSPPPERSPNP
jgi:hypothetical protein